MLLNRAYQLESRVYLIANHLIVYDINLNRLNSKMNRVIQNWLYELKLNM